MKKKLRLLIFFIVLLIPLNIAIAFDQLPASSPNPVGSGARALGMGGAFIGVADDATAASWNPGGLTQVEKPEFSIVVNGFHRIEDNTFGSSSNPLSNGEQPVTKSNLNYFSATLPFVCFNKNMVISLNYQNLYDLNREWNFPATFDFDPGENEYRKYNRKGNLYALGFASCIEFDSWFSFGFTINFWEDNPFNKWEESLYISGERFKDGSRYSSSIWNIKNSYSFSGINSNIGLLLSKHYQESTLQTGLIFKFPFRAKLKGNGIISYSENYDNPKNHDGGYNTPISLDNKLDMPMSYGIGVAYRTSDKITLSFDIYKTHWEDYIMMTDPYNKERGRISPITGKSPEESDIESTYQARIGFEHLFYDDNQKAKNIKALRLGAFYDAAPAEGSPDDFWGVTFGGGWITKLFSADFALQYRWGNDVGSSMLHEDYKFSQDLKEWNVYLSFIYYIPFD